MLQNGRMAAPPSDSRDFLSRAAILVALVALAAVVWYTATVFLLAFAGALLAVFLDFLACKLAEAAGLRRGWAFAIVTAGIAVLLALAGYIGLPRVADQVNQLVATLPEGFARFESYLNSSQWGQTVARYLPDVLASSGITAHVSTFAERAFYALAGLVVVAVAGVYLGATPELYQRGFFCLFPERRLQSARKVMNEVAYTLRWWVIGQLIPMGVLGVATMVGLMLLHIHLAFTLGLFTALMIFIPYIGSLIALAVTLLATLIQGAQAVLYVTLLFIGIHVAEGYLLTPLVQRRAVYLPPALTILTQVLMGLLLGFLGLALATPLTAAVVVLVKMLYLHELPEHHG